MLVAELRTTTMHRRSMHRFISFRCLLVEPNRCTLVDLIRSKMIRMFRKRSRVTGMTAVENSRVHMM